MDQTGNKEQTSTAPLKEKAPLPRGKKIAKLRFRRSCAWMVGLVYFISGILKLIDPTGSGLVVEEYFHFLHLGFLLPFAKASGTAFAFLEVTLGAALLTGIWRKIIAICITTIHSFFTLLTALLLIFNPVMDCGCFGEAIHLTHLETFLKNVILLALIFMAYIPYKKFGTTRKRKYVSFGLIMSIMIFFMTWSLTHLPVVDFTAFKPSATILAANTHLEADDLYESIFIYSKDGESKEFGLDDLPDSTWTFENTITRRKEQDSDAPVLSFYDDYGFFQDSLAAKGQVVVLSVYDPHLKPKRWEKIGSMLETVEQAGFIPLLLVSDDRSADTMPEELSERWAASLFHSDYKTLITLNRSNGGLTYLDDGYIVAKSMFRNFPETEEFKEALAEHPQALMMEQANKGSILLQSLLLACFILIVFI